MVCAELCAPRDQGPTVCYVNCCSLWTLCRVPFNQRSLPPPPVSPPPWPGLAWPAQNEVLLPMPMPEAELETFNKWVEEPESEVEAKYGVAGGTIIGLVSSSRRLACCLEPPTHMVTLGGWAAGAGVAGSALWCGVYALAAAAQLLTSSSTTL